MSVPTLVLFAAAWSTIVVLYLRYHFFTAPASLAAWADAQGCRVVDRGRAPLFESWSFGIGKQGLRYRVVLEDREGRTRRALVRVPPPFPLGGSTAGEPIEARWLDPAEPAGKDVEAYWADADEAADVSVIRGFALADLALAALALMVSLQFLWIREPRMGPLRGLLIAFSAFYLVTAATMAAGGVGMLRRRRWGRACHKLGAALFALTGFGVMYTVVALIYAARPGFNDYFERPKASRDESDPFGDFRGPIG